MKYKSWILKNYKKLITAFLGLALVIVYWLALPRPLFRDGYSTILVDSDGELLGAKISNDEQWRFPPIKGLPDKYKKALILFEDKRFYYHLGVDPFAVVRAAYINLSNWRIVSGASTISMQVIRLYRKNKNRTFFEKFIEMLLAIRLELSYSKEDILSLYASHAPFGGNVVGLEAASWRYFGRKPNRLSWAESSTLVVLPNSPALIHLGRNRNKLKKKRNTLLKRLNEENIISKDELNASLAEPLPDKPIPLPRITPHLLDTIIKKNKEEHRFEVSIKKDLQLLAATIVTKHSRNLKIKGINNIALLIVNNQSFKIVAYIGNSAITGDLGYAIDLIQRPRSTGSILKPFLFAAMIKAGDILPKTLVPDVPTQYSGYIPKNMDRKYRGAVEARIALIKSLNVPAVRMLQKYGIVRFYNFLKQMGMTTLHRSPYEYGLTLILGGAEATLYDLTAMYANLAYIARQRSINQIYKYKKLSIIKRDNTDSQWLSQLDNASAWLTLDALSAVNRPDEEAYWYNFNSSQKIAWKTGTSYGLRDAWAIGTTNKYTVGVWVGNASGEGKADIKGISSAAPILFDVFNILDTSKWFNPPYNFMKKVELCKNDGYIKNGGCKKDNYWMPQDSHFSKLSPYNRIIHIDKNGWQVHSGCESPSNMIHKSWFILPPAQEFYYKKRHPNYINLPSFRKDCIYNTNDSPVDILYPPYNSIIYIPVDLGERNSKMVFKAVHRNKDETLYWHLNNNYIGSTKIFHEKALYINPGIHNIVVVDESGNQLTRQFEVLAKENP